MCKSVCSDLGKKIRAIRQSQMMTQATLCDGIITRNMLSRIENGQANPSLSTLCALSERLNVSISYLMDDNDDGTKRKDEGILSLAKKEMSVGNYDLALTYLKGVQLLNEQKERLKADCKYHLGEKMIFASQNLKQAQQLISDSLKNEECLESKIRNEGRAYRALLDGFIYNHEAGKEEEAFLGIRKFVTFSCDLSVFSGVVHLIHKKEYESAELMADASVYKNQAYYSLLKGVILHKKGSNSASLAMLIKALSQNLPSPLSCYCLTVLEKVCAELKDFEKAYSYMNLRKELIKKLI